MILLMGKKDKNIKVRMQRAYISREEAAITTAESEAIITTGVIGAKQKRDVMTLDIPNAFVQTYIALYRENITMDIRGQVVHILLESFPGVYNKYVCYKGK